MQSYRSLDLMHLFVFDQYNKARKVFMSILEQNLIDGCSELDEAKVLAALDAGATVHVARGDRGSEVAPETERKSSYVNASFVR